jgi:hypothetical protein
MTRGWLLSLLLASSAAVASAQPLEGIILPPTLVMQPPPRVQTGMTRKMFWMAFGAQAAGCLTQEWGYKHVADQLEQLGVQVPTQGLVRLRNCTLQIGPVIGLRVLAHYLKWPRPDADSAVLPSAPWGIYAAVKNIKDVQRLDRQLEQVRGR